jgi:thiol-disulfide isomerase/thioredoxin
MSDVDFTSPRLIFIWSPGCSACKASKPVVTAAAARYGLPLHFVNRAENVCRVNGVEFNETPTIIYVQDRLKMENVLVGPAVHLPKFDAWLRDVLAHNRRSL